LNRLSREFLPFLRELSRLSREFLLFLRELSRLSRECRLFTRERLLFSLNQSASPNDSYESNLKIKKLPSGWQFYLLS